MKKKFAILLALVITLTACHKKDDPANAVTKQPDRHFYYEDTTWGMSMDEVIVLKGEPDLRSDVPPEGETAPDTPNVDFYYKDKTIFVKYAAAEQFLFDAEHNLYGVIDLVDLGEVADDGSNVDQIIADTKDKYMDIRTMLIEKYGEPAAEYTAYQEEGSYKTDELLDLEKEGAAICATRWDGDDYRFIYIIYFMNDGMLDVRYIPHDADKVEEVDRQNNENANKTE